MKDRLRTIRANATLTFPFEVEVEDGEDVKRALYEEAFSMIDPPFDGWFLRVEEE